MTPRAATASSSATSACRPLQGGWISAQTIEAGRIAAQQYLRTEGRLYIRVFPHKPITSIPLETRMGKGKGEPEYWAAVVRPGTVLYEIGGDHRRGGADVLRPPGPQDAGAGAIPAPASQCRSEHE